MGIFQQKKLFIIIPLLIFAITAIPHVFQSSIWNDETVYMWLSNKVLQNPLFLINEQFGRSSFPYFLVLSSIILNMFLSSFHALRLASLVIGFLGIIFTYLIVEKQYNEYAALVAGSLLAINPLYVFLTDRVLVDVPLAVANLIMIYFLLKFDPDDKKSGILAGLSVALPIYAKISGILSIAVALIYVVWKHRELKLKRGTIWFVLTFSAVMLVFFIHTFLMFGSIFPVNPAALSKSSVFSGSKTFYMEQSNFIYSTPLFILGIGGAILSLLKNSKMMPVTIAFAIYFLWFSMIIGEKVPRYVIQTVPLVIILSVYLVFEALQTLNIPSQAILVMLLLVPLTYAPLKNLIENKSNTYTGFAELGNTIKELNGVQNFSRIYTQSSRQIRAFSGIDYVNIGGKIQKIPMTLEELKNQTNILMELDIWEYASPKWAYPLTQEKLNTILNMGFKVVHVTSRPIQTKQGLQKVPVGFLLAR